MKIFRIFIKFILLTIFIFGGIVLIFSKFEQKTYLYEHNFENAEWGNNIEFEFDIVAFAKYEAFLLLRHNSSLKTKDILYKFSIQDSIGITKIDTLELNTIDTNGMWIGRGLSLKTLRHSIYKDSLSFKKGHYKINIEPLPSEQKIKGIESVAIVLNK